MWPEAYRSASLPDGAVAFQLGPGVRVRLSIKEHLQAVVLPVHFHTAPVKLPAGKLPLRLFGKLFDTGLYPADLRVVVGKLVAFKGPRVAPPA